jgi:hypothetical protein
MNEEFKTVVQDFKGVVEEALTKFEEVKKFGMNSTLSQVETHLNAAKDRLENELSKYVTPAPALTPEPSTQSPATNGQTGTPSEPGPEPTTPEVPENTTETPPAEPQNPETPAPETEVPGVPETTPETPVQSETEPSPEATPVVQPEPTGTDETRNGEVAANTPSGQPTQTEVTDSVANV